MSLIVLVLLLILYWVSKPYITQWIPERPTPTPTITSTPSPIPTRPPTNTPTITPTPLPTMTPAPTSAYEVKEIFSISPPIPEIADKAYILNEEDSVQVNPPFDNPQWYSSETIGEQLGATFPEPFYATLGAGWISWSMDLPLPTGLYEVYVLDTNTSSGGFLDFTVSLNDTPLEPRLGQARARYKSSFSNPPQAGDEWRSIGIYAFDPSGVVSVTTSWEDRDESSIVAVDRVLIVALPQSSLALSAPFPLERMTFIQDDTQAVLEMEDPIFTNTDRLAWGDRYQFVVNPDNDVIATWALKDAVPVGQYEILVWIPEIQGSAEATYQVLVNGSLFQSDSGAESVTIQHGGREGGEWVSLGRWSVPDIYGNVMYLTLTMTVPGGTAGEVAFDGVAFMKSPD